MLPSAKFEFSRRPLVDSEQSSNFSAEDVHPIELVVQTVVGRSLDALNNKLDELQQSQVVLVARMRMLERKLNKIEDQIAVASTGQLIQRSQVLKTRLSKIVGILEIVRKRVDGIEKLVSVSS